MTLETSSRHPLSATCTKIHPRKPSKRQIPIYHQTHLMFSQLNSNKHPKITHSHNLVTYSIVHGKYCSSQVFIRYLLTFNKIKTI